MSKVRILSPRPENSNRRFCGGFIFLFGTCGFKRQNSFVGFERFTRFITKCDKSACILVLIRTALMLVLIYSDSLGLARKAPNLWGIRDNLPAFNTWQIYSLSPRPENSNRRFCGGFLFCFIILTLSSRVVFFKNVIFSPFSNFFIFLSCFLVPYVFALLCQSSNWTHRNNPMPFRTSINIICRIVNYL